MERIARCRLLRRLIDHGRRRTPSFPYYSLYNRSQTLLLNTSSSSSPSSSSSAFPDPPAPAPVSNLLFLHHRFLSSASDSSNIISIDSEHQFNTSLAKAQDESLPAIFYFTAVWCGPCRLLSPVIKELSHSHPQVTIFKIDIDQEGLESPLRSLQISAVPTLQFFHEGKKAAEIIGADIASIKSTMEKLYK